LRLDQQKSEEEELNRETFVDGDSPLESTMHSYCRRFELPALLGIRLSSDPIFRHALL